MLKIASKSGMMPPPRMIFPAVRIRITATVLISPGTVTCHTCCQRLAPSMVAASYSSELIADSAPSY